MNEMTQRLPDEEQVEAVAAHELTAVAGGTEYGTGGCATMWPRDPRTGLPVPPRSPDGWLLFSPRPF